MSICLLFVMLIFIVLVIYKSTRLHMLSPSFLMVLGFLVSTFFCIIKIGAWYTDIKITSILLILLGIISFYSGDMFGEMLCTGERRIKFLKSFEANSSDIIHYSLIKLILLEILIIAVNIAYFRYTYEIALRAGNGNGIAGIFNYARHALNDLKIDFEPPLYVNQGIVFTKVLSNIYIYIFVNNTMKQEFKLKTLVLLLPMISNIVNIALNTGRIEFIKLITYIILIIFFAVSKFYPHSLSINKKYIKILFRSFILMCTVFSLLGMTTGKTQYFGIINQIITYIGASIIAFDKYLDNIHPNDFFGKETLRLLYVALSRIGISVHSNNEYFLDFISIGNSTTTNVYTAFRRYFQDYDLIGMMLILFMLGAIFGNVFKKVYGREGLGILSINCAAFAYPIFLMSIEECALRYFLSLATIYQLIYTSILFYVIVTKDNLRCKINDV